MCGKAIEPLGEVHDPAVEAGLILSREVYGDGETLCRECLAGRGRLAMMYCTEFYG